MAFGILQEDPHIPHILFTLLNGGYKSQSCFPAPYTLTLEPLLKVMGGPSQYHVDHTPRKPAEWNDSFN